MRNEEMIAMVECFIHHKTGKQIRIEKPRNHHDFFLLTKAFENCKGFFIKR
jgi:hypothetical protein